MECILHNNHSIKKSVNDFSIVSLLYEVNKDIFDTFEQPEPNRFIASLKSAGGLPIGHFFIDLRIQQEVGDKGDITCSLTNSTDAINNIQFESFTIHVQDIEDNNTRFKVDYKINEAIYARIVLRTIDRIISSIVTRLVSFLNEIPNAKSI
jgi:hypothetical protein